MFNSKEKKSLAFLVGGLVLLEVGSAYISSYYLSVGMVTGAIGIFTITPSEASVIAADVASKASDISIGFVDRFSGSLLISGDVAAVTAALKDVMRVLCDEMGFTPTKITKS